jgi:hypothetical protein
MMEDLGRIPSFARRASFKDEPPRKPGHEVLAALIRITFRPSRSCALPDEREAARVTNSFRSASG